jgi:hypothetical protein
MLEKPVRSFCKTSCLRKADMISIPPFFDYPGKIYARHHLLYLD